MRLLGALEPELTPSSTLGNGGPLPRFLAITWSTDGPSTQSNGYPWKLNALPELKFEPVHASPIPSVCDGARTALCVIWRPSSTLILR